MKYYGKISDPKDLATKEFTEAAVSGHHDDTKLDANPAITGATKTKITYDSKGLVTGGADLTASDIPDLELSKIKDVDASAAEVNTLHGVTTTSTQLNYLNTATSNIQTQLNAKEPADATILKKANVVDNVTTVTANVPLSANQGKLLNDRINNLESIGRFLSVWNCVTGKPVTDPTTLPYSYKSGDYYRVGTVGATNYKPNGSSYTGAASTTQETEKVDIGYIYYYDGSVWSLQAGSPEGKVQDVQVDGTSILSGGIANLTGSNAPSIKLEKISDVTATPAEVNTLHGVTTTSTELNYVHGVTSSIQTQLNNKQNSSTAVTHTASTAAGSATQPVYVNASGVATATTYALNKTVPSDAVFTDTKNTAGSTDTSSKIFLVGATSQAANPQTYSHDTAYVGTDGCLYSGGNKVLTAHQDISGKEDKSNKVSAFQTTPDNTHYPSEKLVKDQLDTKQDAIENLSYVALDTLASKGHTHSVGITSGTPSATQEVLTSVKTEGSVPTLGTAISADDITSWSAGTLPSLGTAISVNNVTSFSAGTAPSLTSSSYTIPNVTSVGTLPSLGTAITADDITSWSAGSWTATPSEVTAGSGIYNLTLSFTAPTLSYSAKSIPNVTSVGTLPSLGTAFSVKGINAWSAGTVPSLVSSAVSIPNVTSVGTLPNLSYTARSIPNVTSVGTMPTFNTGYAAGSAHTHSVSGTTGADA